MDFATYRKYRHYQRQLDRWGEAKWDEVVEGGPPAGDVPLPEGAPVTTTPPGGPPTDPPVDPPVTTPPTVPAPPTTSGTIYWVIDPSAATLVSLADLAAFAQASNDDLPLLQAQWPNVAEWSHVAVGAPGGPASAPPPSSSAVIATLVDTLPEATNALAYHSVDAGGFPFIRVGVKVCLDNGVAWQSAADHETKELTVDPGCTFTATDPATGWVYALENADPVESSGYKRDGVAMSDSVGPAWFGLAGPPATPALDLTGVATAAFTMSPGGYVIVDKNDGAGPQAVYGEQFPAFRRAHVEALGRMGTPRRPAQAPAS